LKTTLMQGFFAVAALGAGVASAQVAQEYPTMDRVAYALECMREHGGQTLDNLYSCSCMLDAVAQVVSFDDYSEVQTYVQFKKMPGDKGGIFRESERAEELLKNLSAAEASAEKRCFIARKGVPEPAAADAAAAPRPAETATAPAEAAQ
jgi:hypothetical protein